jgi:metallo-beta-lactamase class B
MSCDPLDAGWLGAPLGMMRAMLRFFRLLFSSAVLLLTLAAHAQTVDPLVAAYPAADCPSCAEWNAPETPYRVFGNTYFVGTKGLSAILITSDEGHVLIDGGLPASAPRILENVKTLGFDPADIVLILNSHAHYDHAGGIAALQRASGARVAASEASAAVLKTGRSGADDPQFGVHLDFPAVPDVERFAAGAVLEAGGLSLQSHSTPGHTPGGTSWSWTSCEGERCLHIVYADSLTPISADGFLYSENEAAVAGFHRAFKLLEDLPCDVLLTPHPGASAMPARRADGRLIEPGACRTYAATAREQLARRLAKERAAR